MRALVIAAALLLGGCWEGPLFYSASDAVQVLEPGQYESQGPDGPDSFTVVESEDGMTVIQEGQRQDRFGLAPVDQAAGRYVAWTEPDEDDPPGAAVQYQMLQRLRPGEYLLYYPSCEGREAELAVSAGAEVISDVTVPTCRFRTRDSLERAMGQLIPRREASVRLIRVSDGPR